MSRTSSRGTPSRRSLIAGGAAAVAAPPAAPARGAVPSHPAAAPGGVVPGADAAAARGWAMLRGRRVGVISNPTGVLRDTTHVVDSLAARGELEVVGVFGPEHGFRGSAQAGGSEGRAVDPRTGLTVYDAYGADAAKLAGLFGEAGADTVVFDIQDVGVRFYTYIWTMLDAMVAARSVGARFVVLDRPSPLGRRADGPLLRPAYASGIGAGPVVQQHGMTVGELARFFNGELLPGTAPGGRVELEVVPVRGWRPGAAAGWPGGLPWVPPSPNMPTPDTAAVYAGTGYAEGTSLSEGRGTTRPFEFIGAPFLDHRFGDRLNARGLPGVRFREAYFVPVSGKHSGLTCAGVQLHITDRRSFRPIPAAVALLAEARRYEGFGWREDSWDARRPFWIDKLSGSSRLREMIDAGRDTDEVVAAWRGEVRDFERRRRPYLLYR